MDLDEQDAATAAARRARARQLRLERDIGDRDANGTTDKPKKPIIDLTGPRLRLFARSGEFPRAERADARRPG